MIKSESQITWWVGLENSNKTGNPQTYSQLLGSPIRFSTWRSKQQRFSWNVIPSHLSQLLRSIPATDSGSGSVVLLHISISYVFERLNPIYHWQPNVSCTWLRQLSRQYRLCLRGRPERGARSRLQNDILQAILAVGVRDSLSSRASHSAPLCVGLVSAMPCAPLFMCLESLCAEGLIVCSLGCFFVIQSMIWKMPRNV